MAAVNPYGRGARRDVVAPADLVYGTVRMYQMTRSPAPDEFEGFRELDPALRWLAVTQDELPTRPPDWARRADPFDLPSMLEPVTEYYLLEFPTPTHAEHAANAVSAACSTLVVDAWPLRPVIWSAPPLAPTGALYMSVGAIEVARAIGLRISPVCRVPVEQLPRHRVLLVGGVRDRISAEQARRSADVREEAETARGPG